MTRFVKKGFEPDHITVKQGEETTLIFSRETDQTVRFPKTGDLRYACGIDMVSGVITVQ